MRGFGMRAEGRSLVVCLACCVAGVLGLSGVAFGDGVSSIGRLGASPLEGPLVGPGGLGTAVESTEPAAEEASSGHHALEAIEPYSKHPSETRPYAVCPPPTKTQASCMAIGVPSLNKLASLGLVAPSYEGSGEGGGFSPADLRSAYKLPSEGGEGQTVAIVDAYDDPNAKEDLAEYRAKYKLPSCGEGCFEKVNQKGEAKNYPEASGSWGIEISLDLDMVSATCPKCHILLVEAENAAIENLLLAVEEAAKKEAKVISDSWAGAEFSGETSDDHYLNHPGIPILFASGDYGYGVLYPSASPDVVAVGGTSLEKDSVVERGWKEKAWSDAGSGCSEYEEKLAWQKDEGCSKRTVADVSAVASPETPVSVYDTYPYDGTKGKWWLVGGTSAATPLVAGVEMLSSSAFRSAGPRAFYAAGQGGGLFDVSEGYNGLCETYLCDAEVGYDGPTGWGTPDGPQALPGAFTEAAKIVSTSKATLHGAVDPNGHATKYYFQYGTSTSYGSSTPEETAGSSGEYVEVSQTIEGLKAQTTYHYRTVATNSEGTFYGIDRTFGTTPPAATTGAAGEVHANNATVHATVDPEGLATKYYFEYGTSTSYGRAMPVAPKEVGSGTANVEVSTVIGALTGSKTYHFRVVARSTTGGTVYGKDATFTTGHSEWATQQTPSPEEENELAHVSCVSQSDCMAIGYTFVSAEIYPYFERWNGSNWIRRSMPLGKGGVETELRDIACASENWCVAVGRDQHDHGAGTTATWEAAVEQWNGSEWTVNSVPVPEGTENAYLEGVSCTSVNACMAVGFSEPTGSEGTVLPLILTWNGEKWSLLAMPPPLHGSDRIWPAAVSCTSSSWCMVVGSGTERAGNHAVAQVWTSEGWTTVQDTSLEDGSFLPDVSCAGPDACTALISDSSVNYSKKDTPDVERWEGKEWKQEALPEPVGAEGGEPLGISCSSADACAVVGASFVRGSWVPVAFGWNGSSWSLQSTADEAQEKETPAGFGGLLEDVSCVSAIHCVAAGGYIVTVASKYLLYTNSRPLAEVYQTPPEAVTEAASSVKQTEATLNGTVNPTGADTSYYFEYGHTTSYGSKTGEVDLGSGTSNVKVSAAKEAFFGGEDSCTSSTACEAVGDYENSSGVELPLAERWNGTEWLLQSVPSPAGAKQASLTSVSCRSTECEAVEYYENSSGVKLTLAERWNGTEWEIQSTPNLEGAKESRLTSVSCSTAASFCTAVGYYKNSSGIIVTLAERWNGTEWTIQSTPNPEGATESALEGVSCSGPGEHCTATGSYKNSSGVRMTLAESWSGSKWAIKSTVNPEGAKSSQLEGVSCTEYNGCTSTGYYENSSSVRLPLAERWNGTKWEVQSTPTPEGAKASYLYGVSCTSSTACTTTGFYENASSQYLPLAEQWNGTEWKVQSVPSPEGAEESKLGGVSCTSSTFCTATGIYKNSSGIWLPLTEIWNGTKWEIKSTSYPGEPLTGLEPDTTYHFRIVAVNIGGTTYGADRVFNTMPNVPKNTVLPVALPTTPDQAVPESTTTGTWTNEPTSYAYQWERCNATGGECKEISGATSSKYTPVEADVEHALIVKVTAKNSGGEGSALSNATNQVKPIGQITEYSLPSFSNPTGITAGPDGNLWFTEDAVSERIGKITMSGAITEYSLPSGSDLIHITEGPDGNLWFTAEGTSKIGKITTSGTITEYSLPSESWPFGITAGPDSNLWFADRHSNKIGKITTSGTITEYALPKESEPFGITVGSDGNLWFADHQTSEIGKITTSGTITEYALPKESEPFFITAGPDGNLWFADYHTSEIGKITTSGIITEYALPKESRPDDITAGLDGNLWFTDNYSSKIGRITTSGIITEYVLPKESGPYGITTGPDDNLWFTNFSTSKIGKITP